MNGEEDMLKLTKIKSGKALRRRVSEWLTTDCSPFGTVS